MEKINKILEKIEIASLELLKEDLNKICSDMVRRTERHFKTTKDPEDYMKKVIKLTTTIAKKSGYREQDVIKFYYDEFADQKIPGGKNKGKLWNDWFQKTYKKI